MGEFTTKPGDTISTELIGGLWTFNLYCDASDDTSVSFYGAVYYVDALGANETQLAIGSVHSAVQVFSTLNIIPFSIYVPDTVLPDLTYRYRVKIFANFKAAACWRLYFRDSTASHVHTTLAANPVVGPTGPTGPMGPQGIQGSQGIQGPTGSTGGTPTVPGGQYQVLYSDGAGGIAASANLKFNAPSNRLAVIGDISAAAIHFGGTAAIGSTGADLLVSGSLIPSSSLTYNIGGNTHRWNEVYIGPGTLNIAGPAGSSATIGTDQAGIIYTQSGFASPSVIVGPQPGATGAVGGWYVNSTGPTGSDYDLIAQQNVNTAGGGLTGPVYSLLKKAGTGITIAGATISIANTGVVGGAYTNANVTVNPQGQITSIANGSGTLGPAGPMGPTGATGATGATGETGATGDTGSGVTPVFNWGFTAGGTVFDGVTIQCFPAVRLSTTSNGSISIIANVAGIGPGGNGATIASWVDISGTTISSDITYTKTKDNTIPIQNVIHLGITSIGAGTYNIRLFAHSAGGNSILGNSHLTAIGNLTYGG
ncbi:MAG: collagen-like protein [Actinobacteria bacterium]|nr:collagen-like protein [Actinomycetota bacterium]